MGHEGLQAETVTFRGHNDDQGEAYYARPLRVGKVRGVVGAGHGFFSTDRPAYRAEQAVDGRQKDFAFFEKHRAAAKSDAVAR